MMVKTNTSTPKQPPVESKVLKKKKKNKKNMGPAPIPSSAKSTTTPPAIMAASVNRVPTLSASAAHVPKWLGPRASWYTHRDMRRADQGRHTRSPANEVEWTTRLNEYLDREDEHTHIPSRVYNTVVDTARTPSRTMFSRYGWVQTFADYDAYAQANPGKYAYELWFGHRGMARASLDARQALIRHAAAYDHQETDTDIIEDGSALHAEASADERMDNTSDHSNDTPSVSPVMVDDVHEYGNMPFVLDATFAEPNIEEEDCAGHASQLLECDDNDTF